MPGEATQIAQMSPEDCEMVFAWRNHPTIIALSGSGQNVSKAEHTAWFNRAVSSPDRLMFKILAGTAPVGQLRFDLSAPTTCIVSIYVLPEHAGGQHGRTALLKGLSRLRTHWPAVTQVIAEVIPSNASAQRFFTGLGFAPQGTATSSLTTFSLTLESETIA